MQNLIIIGGGSAGFAAAIKANELGTNITMINAGLPLGGACVNVGCVPSKTLLRAAETLSRAMHNHFKGIKTQGYLDDFKATIKQKQDLIKTLRQKKYADILAGLADLRLIEGKAKFITSSSIEVNNELLNADKFIIATGAAPFIPENYGLPVSEYLTNEAIFNLEKLPESLIVIGGRYIALETAQLFARFGSKVTILQRSSHILPMETPDLTDGLRSFLEDDGINIYTRVKIENIEYNDNQIHLRALVNGDLKIFKSTHILSAAGRVPNTLEMGLEDIGIKIDSKGFLKVNKMLETTVSNIYGAGDVTGEPMFVYTGAYEGALAAENAIANTLKERSYNALPWVIFTDPQLCGVGLDENQAAKKNIDCDTSVFPLSMIPRSIAAHDTRGFIKLIRDKKTHKLIGARILAPEGSELLMQLSMAIKFGMTTDELSNYLYPYLTLSEGIKLAATTFEKDIDTLSCCTS
jgi:mercuric reductase